MAGPRCYKLFFLGLLGVVAFPSPPVHPAQAAFTANERKPALDPVKPESNAALWHDPGEISALDLAFGEGGRSHAPRNDAIYSFEKEDLGGTSTKFYVKDQSGVEWLGKVGDEARRETAATRFVWAMGYFTDEDYFLPSIHVSGMVKLHRQNQAIHKDGTVTNARLKRIQKGRKKLDTWAWADNPFLGSRELNGLRVIMALVNNWDLKTINNKVYGPKEAIESASADDNEKISDLGKNQSGGDVRYAVSDLGASFGRTGGVASRSKGKLKDYQKDNFIRAINPETVDFVMRTNPAGILRLFRPQYYRQRTAMADTVGNIPRADAKWIGRQLARLSPEQIRSAFLAAGFTPKEADGYLIELKKRIGELNEL